MKGKITTSILIVSIIIIIVVGITYAYVTWSSGKINAIGNSECFNVLYVKGQDIGSDQSVATLMPSNDYTGGLSSTVKMGFSSSCTNVSGTGIIKLNTLDTTSSNLYRTGLLNYVVLKNGTKLKEGNITGFGTTNIDVGLLKKISNIDDADSYTVYVWISNNLVQNEDAFSSYYGNIAASAEQVSD